MVTDHLGFCPSGYGEGRNPHYKWHHQVHFLPDGRMLVKKMMMASRGDLWSDVQSEPM
jgi:hypothetical protein